MIGDHERVYPLAKRIATRRLELRQFDVKDAEAYYDLEQVGLAGHMAPYMPGEPDTKSRIEGIREMRAKIRTALDKWDDDIDYRFVIREHGSETIVGQIAITTIIRNVAQSAFVGYWIAASHLRKGFATEATAAVLEYAFESLRLHRISVWIAPENLASLRVVEKLSLRYEGTAVRALFQGGKWTDTRIYAITSEEWHERKNELQALYQ